MEKERALRKAQDVYNNVKARCSYIAESFKAVVESLQLADADPAMRRLVFKAPVENAFLNSANTMHGGASMAIADFTTQIIRKVYEEEERTATTTQICTEFLRPAVKGDRIVVLV